MIPGSIDNNPRNIYSQAINHLLIELEIINFYTNHNISHLNIQ